MFPRVLSLAAAVVACSAPPAVADTLRRANGLTLEDVQVTQARWDQVQYRQGTQTFSLKGDDVESIERESRHLQPIRELIRRREFPPASTAAAQLKQNSGVDWEKSEASFLEGQIRLEAGEYKAADVALKSFLDAHEAQKDWWVPHAVYGRGVCALEQSQGRTAELHFKALAAFGNKWSGRAKLGNARALLLANKLSEARQLFAEVARDAQSPLAAQQEGMVGKARVLVLQKDFRGAVAELEREFFPRTPKAGQIAFIAARAEATLLMGRAHKALGGKENLEIAEIWLLKVAALYRDHPTIFRDASKELADVYTQLGRADRAAAWTKQAEK